MKRKSPAATDAVRARQRLTVAVKQSLRDLRMHLALLNLHVGAHVELKDVDLDCLDFIVRYGPLSPSALARHVGLHPATITGILDRLERGGWVTRERDLADRRGVVVRARHSRNAELMRLYSSMNTSMDQICAGYQDAELELLVDFLQRCTSAGRSAAEALAID